jgi:hypothetical protein
MKKIKKDCKIIPSYTFERLLVERESRITLVGTCRTFGVLRGGVLLVFEFLLVVADGADGADGLLEDNLEDVLDFSLTASSCCLLEAILAFLVSNFGAGKTYPRLLQNLAVSCVRICGFCNL